MIIFDPYDAMVIIPEIIATVAILLCLIIAGIQAVIKLLRRKGDKQ